MAEAATKIVAGGIYEMTRPDGSVEQSMCICTLRDGDTVKGWMQRFGFAREQVVEGSEFMESLKLVGKVVEPYVAPPPKKKAVKKITRKKSSKSKE